MTTCEHGALARTCIICSEWKPRALEAEAELARIAKVLDGDLIAPAPRGIAPRVAALVEANAALAEVERRIRDASPKFVAWMKESNAPKEILEAYKWAIYGSAIYAQAFIHNPLARKDGSF